MVLTSLLRTVTAVGIIVAVPGSPLIAQKVSSPDSIAKASGPLGFRVHYVTAARYPVIDSILPGSWADLGHVHVGDSLVAVINMLDNMTNQGFPNYNWITGGLFFMLVRRDASLISFGLNGLESTGSSGGGGAVRGGIVSSQTKGPAAPGQPVPPPSTRTPPAKAPTPPDFRIVIDSLIKAAVERGPIPGSQAAPQFSKKVGTATIELKGAASVAENPTTGVLTITVAGTTITIRPPN